MGLIVFDDKQSKTFAGANPSEVVTTPDTANRLLVASIGWRNATNAAVTMALAGAAPLATVSKVQTGAANYKAVIGWWLNPPVGSNTVQFTCSAPTYTMSCAVYSLSNVNLSDPLISYLDASGNYASVLFGAIEIGQHTGTDTPALGADQIALEQGVRYASWYTNPCQDGSLTATFTNGYGVTALFRPAAKLGGPIFIF